MLFLWCYFLLFVLLFVFVFFWWVCVLNVSKVCEGNTWKNSHTKVHVTLCSVENVICTAAVLSVHKWTFVSAWKTQWRPPSNVLLPLRTSTLLFFPVKENVKRKKCFYTETPLLEFCHLFLTLHSRVLSQPASYLKFFLKHIAVLCLLVWFVTLKCEDSLNMYTWKVRGKKLCDIWKLQ